jgi:hypothetical protein
VPPPDAVILPLKPLHSIETPLILAVGSGFTITVLIAVDVQPLLFVAVTVYVVVVVGLMFISAVNAVLLH